MGELRLQLAGVDRVSALTGAYSRRPLRRQGAWEPGGGRAAGGVATGAVTATARGALRAATCRASAWRG